MEPNLMMKTAAVVLGVGALGGLVMAGIRLKGTPRPPSLLAMLHGLLGGAGLTLLIYAAFTLGLPPVAAVAILVLLTAALIGVWLNIKFHSQMLPLPIPPLIVHALIAIVGFGLLLVAVIMSPSG